jgi:hypothetical protein
MTYPMYEDDGVLPKDPTVEASDQITDAILDIKRKPHEFLHLPWKALDDAVGGIGSGEVWFVGAYSGHGKTTFLTSALDSWFQDGKRIYYMGLESRPKILRTHWACKRLGLDAGDVLTGKLSGSEGWEFTRERLAQEIQSQMSGNAAERVYFSPRQFVNAAALRLAAQEAADLESDVFIIDHVDHLEGSGGNLYEQSVHSIKTLLAVCQEYGLRALAATQFNNEMIRGNRTGMHQAPQPGAVYMGGHKRQMATGMLGLYRPLKFAGVEDDVLKSFNKGHGEPKDVCEPNTMGVSVMKHRLIGNHEGRRIFLGVEKGKVVDLPEHDGPNVHGIRTARGF